MAMMRKINNCHRISAFMRAGLLCCALVMAVSTSHAEEKKPDEPSHPNNALTQDCPGKELFKPFHVALAIYFRSADERPERSKFRNNITSAANEELKKYIDIIPRDQLYEEMRDSLKNGKLYRQVEVTLRLQDSSLFVDSSGYKPADKVTLQLVSVSAWRYLVMSRSPIELASTSAFLAAPKAIEGEDSADYTNIIKSVLQDAICNPVDANTLIEWGIHE
ncbi:MAG: hypothetical protein EPN21_03245 [Methylococcaceae bacterium]|nr:MAG: hypothetical protein EPN21_03245 [Methylococcaceae bacterium]